MQTLTLLRPLPAVATVAAGVKSHLCLATALPKSSTPPNAAAANATCAIEPHLRRPPSPPCTALHYSLPCWQSILPEVATDLNNKKR